jgi:predicted transcriptional regulator
VQKSNNNSNRTEAKSSRGFAWQKRFDSILRKIQNRFTLYRPKEIESDITRAEREAREEKRKAYKEAAMPSSITIKLPDKLEKELEAVMKAEKTSKDKIIKDALSRYLSIKQFQLLRKKVLPFAESQGLLTDEDVFKAIS